MLDIQYYVNRFKITQVNYEFNRVEFISSLKEDLLELIKRHENYNKFNTHSVPYKDFKVLVKKIQDFYKSLSDYRYKEIGKRLTNKLWGVFYASVICEYRKKYYPKIQSFIESNKDNPNITRQSHGRE